MLVRTCGQSDLDTVNLMAWLGSSDMLALLTDLEARILTPQFFQSCFRFVPCAALLHAIEYIGNIRCDGPSHLYRNCNASVMRLDINDMLSIANP